jgi:hypothetical protein
MEEAERSCLFFFTENEIIGKTAVVSERIKVQQNDNQKNHECFNKKV